MSKEAVEQVIGRLVLEPEFRTLLAADASSALSSFDLNVEEKEALSHPDTAELAAAFSVLDERVSKGYRYAQ